MSVYLQKNATVTIDSCKRLTIIPLHTQPQANTNALIYYTTLKQCIVNCSFSCQHSIIWWLAVFYTPSNSNVIWKAGTALASYASGGWQQKSGHWQDSNLWPSLKLPPYFMSFSKFWFPAYINKHMRSTKMSHINNW